MRDILKLGKKIKRGCVGFITHSTSHTWNRQDLLRLKDEISHKAIYYDYALNY